MILNILKIGKSKITCEYLIIIGTVYISVLISYRLKYDIEIFNVVNQFYTVAKGNRIFTLKMPTTLRIYATLKEEAECQKIDAFELWCWRRLLRVP